MHFHEPVSHESFMQRALYDTKQGYYSSHAVLGKRGDFSTSATLCPAFTEAVIHWVKATAVRLKLPTPCPLIELGPGDGSLAKGLSQSLPTWPLHLVETSSVLQSAQEERLNGVRHEHHTHLKGALKKTGGIGLIIANEFVDAFPAVKLRWHKDDWWEVGVTFDNGSPQETLLPLEHGIDVDVPAYPREGQTVYAHPSFHRWLQNNIPALRKGALLLIDYGEVRPARECRAYAGQRRIEGTDIYKNPGQRDITCDVNFADLRRWCQQLGLQTDKIITQADFLKQHLTEFDAYQQTDNAFAFLTHPLGAGVAFKVICGFCI